MKKFKVTVSMISGPTKFETVIVTANSKEQATKKAESVYDGIAYKVQEEK